MMFAAGGFDVTIHNPRRDRPDNIPAECAYSRALPESTPDLILESVPEDLEVKRMVHAAMEQAYGGEPILATNTSGLPIDDIAEPLNVRERFLGIHFFTPAQVSPLVEVIRSADTSEETVVSVVEALGQCGKRALLVSRPIVGHLWNRLQHAILHEAYHLIENGIATPSDIDAIAKELLGPRFCITGLLESKDIGGLAIHLQSQEVIVPHLCGSREPHGILRRLIGDGRQGIRSGKGFFDWKDRDPDEIAATAADKLRRLNAFLEREIRGDEPEPATLPGTGSARDS